MNVFNFKKQLLKSYETNILFSKSINFLSSFFLINVFILKHAENKISYLKKT